jgi:hypothetical protein
MALSARSGSALGPVCSDMGTSIIGQIMLWSYSYCNRNIIPIDGSAERKHTPLPPLKVRRFAARGAPSPSRGEGK